MCDKRKVGGDYEEACGDGEKAESNVISRGETIFYIRYLVRANFIQADRSEHIAYGHGVCQDARVIVA